MAICDRSKQVVHWADSLPSAKMGLYADGRLDFKAAVHEKWLNRGREGSRQKRDTHKGCLSLRLLIQRSSNVNRTSNLGLLPMPRNPIISTCAGTDNKPSAIKHV